MWRTRALDRQEKASVMKEAKPKGPALKTKKNVTALLLIKTYGPEL